MIKIQEKNAGPVATPPKSKSHLNGMYTYDDHLSGPAEISQPKIKGVAMVTPQSCPPEVTETEMYSPPIPKHELMNLTVGAKRKLMLEYYGGNKYESAEVFVSLTVPCSAKSMEDAFGFAQEWVDHKMVAVITQATGGKG